MKHEVKTNTFDDGKIIQETFMENPLTQAMETISRRMIDTQEQQIHDALVTLGWTPPPGI